MNLPPDAIAILLIFQDRGCAEGEIIPFTEFGDAIVWDGGAIERDETRAGLRELIDGGYVLEHNAGLAITRKGLEQASRL